MSHKVALGELFKIGSSKRVLKSQWKTEGVPFYRGREITRLSADGFVDNELFISESDYATYAAKYGVPTPGDIVITAIGTIGNSYIVREEDRFYFKDASVLWFKKETEVSSEFINLWLKSPLFFDQLDRGNGATVDTLTIKKLQSALIDLPPLPEQKRIVAILDEAFTGIDAVVANTEKNLANSRELFESTINSAISGELTKKWRRLHHYTQSSGEHLRQLLVERRCNQSKNTRKKSDLTLPLYDRPIDLPDSWVLASPEQLSTNIIDCPHSTPKWTESGEICLRTTNFKSGFLHLESVRFVSEETYQKRILRLEPKSGDVLYSREGGILGVACIFPHGLKACLGQRMMQFRLDTKLALPTYFMSVLNSQLILSEVRRLTGGAAAPHLNIRDIRTFPIPLPPLEEQYEIINRIEGISAETQRHETIYQQKLPALAELKQSILQKAFAGKL